MKIKKIAILFLLLKCTMAVAQKATSFYGTWCNGNSQSKTEELFQIEISANNNKISAVYYNGGPFEEFYTATYTHKGTLLLFFSEIAGSISFNNASNATRINSKASCKKHKVAECKIISPGQLQVITFKNDCSYLPSHKTILLKKIKENESCQPK